MIEGGAMNSRPFMLVLLLSVGSTGTLLAGDPVCQAFHRMFHMPSWNGSGCGPRYFGARHEESNCPDPCDCRARWVDCHGNRQLPDMLAPWQLPPNRGFQPAEHFGWMPDHDCESCNHHARGGGLFGWHWW